MSSRSRRPLSLTNLRAFESVARVLNFGVAADELHVTQSAVSRQIKGLEDELAGIRSLKVSLRKQRAEIDYDEKKVSEDDIRRAFERAGYGLARA